MSFNKKANSDAEIVIELISKLIAVILICLIETWIGWWLWGVIAVAIFALPELTFLQFFGLMWLLSILIPHTSALTAKKD